MIIRVPEKTNPHQLTLPLQLILRPITFQTITNKLAVTNHFPMIKQIQMIFQNKSYFHKVAKQVIMV